MSDARRIVIEFLGEDKSLGRTVSSVDGKTSKLGSTLGKVGLAAGAAFAGGAIIAGKALYDMTKAAAADQAAQVQLATTLKNTAGATDDQVAKVEDWISAQGRALGVTDDELRPALSRLATATHDVGEAQRLASLAMDVSAGTGKSLESVSTALMKAQNGQISGLSRLGIATTNAAGETLSFDQVTRKMADTFEGQAAAKANTLQGKMDRLRLIFDETKETIGAKLIPVVTQLADWFLVKALPAIEKFGGFLSENVGPVIARIGDVVRSTFGGMSGDVGGPLQDVKDIVSSTVSIVISLWRRFGGILTDYTANAFRNAIQIISGAVKIIAGIFRLVAALLKGDWRGAWEAVKDILRGALQVIVGVLRQFDNVVRTVWRLIWSALKALAAAGWDATKAVVRAGLDAIVNYVKDTPNRIRAQAGLFGQAGKWLIDAFVDGMKNAAGIVSGIAGNVWSAVKGLLNSAIGKLRSALNFTISLPGPDLHVSVGDQIPYLARGTRSFGGGLAMVGERGRELVALPRGSRVYPNAVTEGMLGGDGWSTTIVLQLDSREIWRGLLRQKRLNGTGLGLE